MVPDADVLPTYASTNLGLNTTDMQQLCRNEKVKAAIMESMVKAAKEFGLKGFEQVTNISTHVNIIYSHIIACTDLNKGRQPESLNQRVFYGS